MKQMIAVRKDLKLSKGKMSAQVAHASIGAYKMALKKDVEKADDWERDGSKKVVVSVADERELFALKESVKRLPHFVVVDAGRTHLEPGTATCIGIGPWDDAEIDRYTRHLKLMG